MSKKIPETYSFPSELNNLEYEQFLETIKKDFSFDDMAIQKARKQKESSEKLKEIAIRVLIPFYQQGGWTSIWGPIRMLLILGAYYSIIYCFTIYVFLIVYIGLFLLFLMISISLKKKATNTFEYQDGKWEILTSELQTKGLSFYNITYKDDFLFYSSSFPIDKLYNIDLITESMSIVGSKQYGRNKDLGNIFIINNRFTNDIYKIEKSHTKDNYQKIPFSYMLFQDHYFVLADNPNTCREFLSSVTQDVLMKNEDLFADNIKGIVVKGNTIQSMAIPVPIDSHLTDTINVSCIYDDNDNKYVSVSTSKRSSRISAYTEFHFPSACVKSITDDFAITCKNNEIAKNIIHEKTYKIIECLEKI